MGARRRTFDLISPPRRRCPAGSTRANVHRIADTALKWRTRHREQGRRIRAITGVVSEERLIQLSRPERVGPSLPALSGALRRAQAGWYRRARALRHVVPAPERPAWHRGTK